MPDVEFVFPLKLVDDSTGIAMDIEASGVKKPITNGGKFKLTWTMKNNTNQDKTVTVNVGNALGVVATYTFVIPANSTYTYGPALFGWVTPYNYVEIVGYQKVEFWLSPSYFIVFTNPQMVKKFTIESSIPWDFQGLPYWIAYPSSPVQTPTLTCKLGWVKVGGVEYKGWGGAWYIDGVFKPNPVTITMDRNHTAEVHPGAFSPFLPLEDINLDGRVDIRDVVLVTSAYGASKGEARYNPLADINGDEQINIYDAVRITSAYGEKNIPPPRTVTLYEARVAVSAMASQAMAGAAATAAGIILAETARKIMREVKK
jgi:hypothetical protein